MEPEDHNLDTLIERIPRSRPSSPGPRCCCCGRTECAYFRHNCAKLDELEQEVQHAGRLGKALLVRHEQYIHDAEQVRLEMATKIGTLEVNKKTLEDENERTLTENHDLKEQLETLNKTNDESQTHIDSLEATLQSSRQEIRRLETLANRTLDLEVQLASIELEQETLQNTLVSTQEEERCYIQKWKRAERELLHLHDQLERVEREAREERERHVEVLGRMERQREVERTLDTAAGRLKSAAAATTGIGKNGTNVVSHFVKDILQDNASLQLGIVELREMLMDSNDEVQMLRERLSTLQPSVELNGDGSVPATLRAELAQKESEPNPEPQVFQQNLHIHHHYHGAKKEEARRPRKKRTSINTALFTPPLRVQSPRPPRSQETSSTILSQTSVTIPNAAPITPRNPRWSVQSAQMSEFAPSSVPSSPRSNFRQSGLFDRSYDFDSSRPTSPGSSIDPMSPQCNPYRHRKRGSEVSARGVAAPMNFHSNVIHEEEDDDDILGLPDLTNLNPSSMPSLDDGPTPSDTSRDSEYVLQDDWASSPHPQLRRSTSHESIISISGIDIHTLKSRPFQIRITGGSALLRPKTRFGTPTAVVSMDTIASSSPVVARPILSRQGHDSTAYLRASIQASDSDTHSISSSGSNERAGNKLGGWVFGRWGISPRPSNGDLKKAPLGLPSAQRRVVSTNTPEADSFDPLRALMGRAPGINQKGPIPGYVKPTQRAPSQVMPEVIDHDALREVLMEEALP